MKSEIEILQYKDYLPDNVDIENIFSEIIQTSNDIIVLLDPEGIVTYISPQFSNITDDKVELYLNKHLSNFIDDTDKDHVIDLFSEGIESDESRGLVPFKLKSFSGKIFQCEVNAVNIKDKNNSIIARLCVVRDISYRVKLEEENQKILDIYKLLMRHVSDIIWIVDMSLNLTYMSPSVENILGYKAEEYQKFNSIIELMTQESQKNVMELFIRELELENHGKGDPKRQITIEVDDVHKDGHIVHLELKGSFLRNPDGKAISIIGVSRDITERKSVIDALRESTDKYKFISEKITDIVLIMDFDLNITFVNPSVKRIIGYDEKDIIDTHVSKYLTPGSLDISQRIFQDELKFFNENKYDPNRLRTLELSVYHSSGKILTLEMALKFLRKDDEKPFGIIGIARDISKRKNFEEELRSSEQKYRTIFDTIEDGYYEIDLKGNIKSTNHSAKRILGFENKDIIGVNYSEIFTPDVAQDVYNKFNKIFKTGDPLNLGIFKINKDDGSTMYCAGSATLLKDYNEKPIGFCGIIRDVTKRRKEAVTLKKSEEKWKKLFGNLPGGSFIIGSDGTIVDINKVACQMTGYQYYDIIGEPYAIIYNQNSEIKELRAKGQKKIENIEATLRKENGDFLPVLLSSELIDAEEDYIILINFLDITEIKKAQKDLEDSEKILKQRNAIMEEDLKTAQLIQRSLIKSDIPNIDSVILDYRYLPLDAVGGDYFFAKKIDNDSVGVFIGDVASHGVTAALFSALISATTNRVFDKYYKHPASFMKSLNFELLGNMPMSFLTAVYCVFKKTSDGVELSFSSGGHPHPIIYRKNLDNASYINCKGTLISVFDDIEFEEATVHLKKGDRVFLYTDGIPEAVDKNGKMIGFENLPHMICHSQNGTLSEALDSIITEIDVFRGTESLTDDIILFGIEIK